MQDPTEFRRRFKEYKDGGKPYENGRPRAIQQVDDSDADFAKRLKSNWRLEIWDWKGSGKAVTHKIAGADNIIYPKVLTTKGGGLIDFTNPIWQGNVDPLERAIKNNDYVPMKTESDAIWFGPNYKDYYPGFKNGKLPKFYMGTDGDVDMGERALLTNEDIISSVVKMPHEEGLKNGPIEDAIIGYYFGGKPFTLYNAYNNYRYIKNAKRMYKTAREANDNTRNWNNTGPASRRWKMQDADEYARKWAYSDDPLGFLYDVFVTPLSNVYRSAQKHPKIGPVLNLFE